MNLGLVLFEPEIPQNTGTLIRLTACLGISLTLIEPFGFVWNDRFLKRSAMDYRNKTCVERFPSWDHFFEKTSKSRLILLDAKAENSLYSFTFQPGDKIIMGKESSGVPDHVHQSCHHHLTIPMQPGCRSLNLAVSAAMAVGEVYRQLLEKGF